MTIEFPLRVMLYPAPDLKGQWIAHGLETDIVTQGDSAEHALAMMADALNAVTTYQAVRRRPLLRLRPAPREVWDLLRTQCLWTSRRGWLRAGGLRRLQRRDRGRCTGW